MTERVIFQEESTGGRWVKVTTGSVIDETLLDALTGFVDRCRKRLAIVNEAINVENRNG